MPEFFFFEKVAHRQACNFIKKRLQHRCFTVNFAKLLKALCRTPPVSASNFNSAFLTILTGKNLRALLNLVQKFIEIQDWPLLTFSYVYTIN